MKKFVSPLICFFTLLSYFGYAQSFTFTPSKTDSITAYFNNSQVSQIHVLNNTSGALGLSWKVIYNDLPAAWDISLCDWGTCYPGIPSGVHTPADIMQGDSGFFNLTINPYATAASATLQILVYETGHSSNKDTAVFVINAIPMGTGTGPRIFQDIEIFPNPAKEVLNIFTGSHPAAGSLALYNLIGEKLMSISPGDGRLTAVNVSSLQPGIYFVKYEIAGRQRVIKFIKSN